MPAALAGERVDRVVAALSGLPRAEVAALVAAGAVRVGGAAVTTRSRRVAEGDVVEVDLPERRDHPGLQADPGVVVPVVHRDPHLFVVDKPPDLVVHPGAGHPTGTLVQGLLALDPGLARVGDPARPGIVHRLDRGTSGLMVVARTPEAYEGLVAALSVRDVQRRYVALAWGAFESARGTVDAPVGRAGADPTRMTVTTTGRPARTHYEVRAAFTDPVVVTELECRLETGRTHQIRVHLAAIGHPVVGDRRYGGERASLPAPRPYLHAWRLGFRHPVTGEDLAFEAPLPADLAALRDALA